MRVRIVVRMIATILGLGIAGSSTASAQTRPSSAVGTASLRVRAGSRETVLSMADMAGVTRHELRVAAENSTDSATVSGFTLWDLLQKSGAPSPEASGRQRAAMYVRLKGADGQTAMFALVELDPGFSRKVVLVADRRNGQPLDGAEGPWRVFVPDEMRHARWIRGLVAIDVDTLRP